MITTNIAHKYDDILKAAYEILKDKVTAEENPYWQTCVDQNQMVNLDAYFISFGTLLENIGDNELGPFVLLPLDEPPFEINANTREIKVPDVFKRGVAVQGDCGSEILTFTIDKYFDYVDLNNTDVWIQYTTPDKQEKAYKVDLFDRESIPGKIRFGWVLGPDVTRASGALKFSVRFFKLASGNSNLVEYSFSTLPQTINIHQALQPVINETTDGYTNELFKKVVKNSLAAGIIPADAPRFDTQPAIDLPIVANLTDDTVTLEALATVTDNGIITYNWQYSASEEKPKYEPIANGDTYAIDNTVVKAVLNPEATELIKYYTDASCQPKYEYEGNFVFEQDTTLYKRISTCTIKPTVEGATPKIITGLYRVSAYNTLTTNNQSNPIGSSICRMPAPEVLEVLDNLDFTTDSVVIDAEKQTPITVKVKVDTIASPVCYWKHIATDGTITDVIEGGQTGTPNENGEVTFTLTPTVAGYYYAKVVSELNRTIIKMKDEDKTDLVTETESGDVCVDVIPEIPTFAVRATEKPNAPTLVSGAPTLDKEHKLDADVNGIYTVNSYVNDVTLGHFTADTQNYTWKYILSDKPDAIVITKELSSFVDGPVNEKTIKIKKNTLPDPMIVYCESTVTLNGAESAPVISPKMIVGF